MRNGFIALPLAGYVALGMGAVILILGLALKLSYGALERERVNSVKLQASVALWTEAAKSCSDATEKAAADAKKRTLIALDALKQARIGADSLKGEVARLRAANATGGECLAGQAVAKVREGLK